MTVPSSPDNQNSIWNEDDSYGHLWSNGILLLLHQGHGDFTIFMFLISSFPVFIMTY